MLPLSLSLKSIFHLRSLAQFHYMVLVTLNMLGRRDEAISYLDRGQSI